MADFSEAIRLDAEDRSRFWERALWYPTYYDTAIADLTEAIRLDPKDASANWGRGFAHKGARHFQAAIADFSEAIRLDAEDASAYWERGWAYTAEGFGIRLWVPSRAKE